MTYRVFGSPYNLSFHQSVSYLRHKKVPFKVHNGSLTSTKLMSLWHRAKMSFCTLSPKRETMLLIHQVLEKCEAEAATDAVKKALEAAKKGAADANSSTAGAADTSDTSDAVSATPTLVNAEEYPRLALATWAFFLYGSAWLGSTGSMYRWVHGNGSSVVDDYIAYLSRATSIVPGAGNLVAPRIRNLMVSTLAEIGIVKEAEPYMIEHFFRLCDALEAHFEAIGGPATAAAASAEEESDATAAASSASPYLLGTAHATLADVAMAAAFDGYFLRDDPPAMDMLNKYPCLNRYLALVSELGASNAREVRAAAAAMGRASPSKKGTKCTPCEAAAEDAANPPVTLMTPPVGAPVPGQGGYDHVYPTLQPIIDLMTEIFPWQIAQCDALKQHAKRGLTQEKPTMVDVSTELPLVLWGRGAVVGETDGSASSAAASSSSCDLLLPSGALSGKVPAKLLAPKLKAAPYIMLIDRSIVPAHVRCQEVEMAQICAMGAIGAYPLYTTTAAAAKGAGSEGSGATTTTTIHSCSGASDAFLAQKQRVKASESLYLLANELLKASDAVAAGAVNGADKPVVDLPSNRSGSSSTADPSSPSPSTSSLPPIDLIDFDTHHIKSAEAAKKDIAGGGATHSGGANGASGTASHAMQMAKLRARRAGQREQRHEYDVKKARALAESGGAAADGAAAEGAPADAQPSKDATVASADASSSSAATATARYESDILLTPSDSMDFALARVAMLMGRMYVEEFEIRSVYRNRGIEFAVMPRGGAGEGN